MSRQDAPPVSPGAATVALALLTVAAYGALALAGFVWDDEPLVVRNTITGDWRNLPRMFTVDLWEVSSVGINSGYFRPLMLMSLTLDRALWGLSAAGHHLHSVAWHLAATLGLLSLLRKAAPPWSALAGATVFALHPIQSEAVAFIAARNDLMVATFTFLAASLLWEERPSRGALLGGGLAAAAAAFSKESGLFVGGLVLALDLARFGRPRGWRRYVALALAASLWIGLRTAAGIDPATTPDWSHWRYLFDRLPALGAHYTLKLLWPWPLTTGDTLEYLSPPLWKIVLGLGLGLGGAVAVVVRGGRLALAGLAFAALSFAPSLAAIALRGQMGERYLYAPLGGVALALAMSLRGRALWFAPAFALVSVLTLHQRLPDWQSGLELWASALRHEVNGYTQAAVAHELNDRGDGARACALFAAALQDDPPYTTICENALRCPLRYGYLDKAVEAVALSDAARCEQDDIILGLQGLIFAHVGRWDEALARADKSKNGSDPTLNLVRAAAARQAGDEAAYAARRAAAAGVGPEEFDEHAARLLDAAARYKAPEPGTITP
ncbi:hypothetical protein L6R49_17540 [Myxococcota bacterium]|nr:hypothetical protein [Myxococcota bacterium]